MKNAKGLICFGELMIRLQAVGFEKLVQSNMLEVKFTGAEANVGVSCANYGLPSFAVSQVPSHDLGQACINYLRRFGLDTTHIKRDGDRLGILYTETGYSQRPSKVIYDRTNSSFTEIEISKAEWSEILEGKSWFHFCGTAPAQGQKATRTLLAGLQVAKEKGLTVSADYNYRSKLWSREQARSTMEWLMEYVDIGIGNEEDCEAMFSIKAEGSDYVSGKVNTASYEVVARKMVELFSLKYQAITLRESITASENGWSAIISDGKQCVVSSRYDVSIVDRIGGGDSFTGALIYSLSEGKDTQYAIDFAVAASCLKQTLPGDFNLVSKEDVISLMQGNVSGRVQR